MDMYFENEHVTDFSGIMCGGKLPIQKWLGAITHYELRITH
jgi:hypothetical protein